MPRLTWNPDEAAEVYAAREVYVLYIQRRYVAKHNGQTVKFFDAKAAVLDFELVPSAFDRIMKERAPWEN